MTTYTLPVKMSAETAEIVVQELLALPELPTQLDASSVQQLTTCGAQILVALQKSARAMGRECDLKTNNELVQQTFALLGLTATPNQQGA